MRILVTGADGFVGRATIRALVDQGHDLRVTDRTFSRRTSDVECIPGDLTDHGHVQHLFKRPLDAVVHLASMPGSLAERQPDPGWQANVLAPFALMRAAAAKGGIRFVFASSIAVYGNASDATISPATVPSPQLSYGAHKLMAEVLLSDLIRRGELSGASLRLPGLVARPVEESGHGSAFMSRVIHHAARGEDYDCPVPENARCWWMSRQVCVAAILHALTQPQGPSVVQLPILLETVGAVADAAARFGGHRQRIRWGQDATLTRLFGAMPPLDDRAAIGLGYHGDQDADALVRAALAGD